MSNRKKYVSLTDIVYDYGFGSRTEDMTLDQYIDLYYIREYDPETGEYEYVMADSAN